MISIKGCKDVSAKQDRVLPIVACFFGTKVLYYSIINVSATNLAPSCSIPTTHYNVAALLLFFYNDIDNLLLIISNLIPYFLLAQLRSQETSEIQIRAVGAVDLATSLKESTHVASPELV